MCGQFMAIEDPSEEVDCFGVTLPPGLWEPGRDYFPGQEVAVLAPEAGALAGRRMRWGLVPSWARDEAIARKTFNARLETACDKPAFRAAWRRRRCLIPAGAFYEWSAGAGKQRHRIGLAGGAPFAFAGLWESRERDDAAPLLSCTILTTAANRALAPIHGRMPLLLTAPELWRDWLEGDADWREPDMEALELEIEAETPARAQPDLFDPDAGSS